MYKLFIKQYPTRFPSYSVYFMPKKGIMHASARLCSFCNFYHSNISKFMTHQIHSSTTAINLLSCAPFKKRVKQRGKKYAELLEVTDQATRNKKAIIQKLKASELSMFVNHDDIDSNKTCSNRDSNVNKTFHSEYMQKDCNISSKSKIESNVLRVIKGDTLPINEIKISNEISKISEETENLKTETKKLSKKLHQKNVEVQKHSNRYTTQYYVESLLAHMQVYLSCGLLNRANKTLMKYRKYTHKESNVSNTTIEFYNMLLEAYASKGELEKVLELYNLIKLDSLIPTPQTYSYIFDAIQRENKNKNVLGLIQKLQYEMYKNNIFFNDIFRKSYFKNDQRQNVLKIIRRIVPEFEPSHDLLNTDYTCKLLQKVHAKNNYESPAKDLLTMEELKRSLRIQFQNESTIEMQIESIEKQKRNVDANSKIKQKILEIENKWKETASAAFQRNLVCLKEKECHVHNSLLVLHPFLEVLDRQHYINAILREIRQIAQGSDTYSVPLRNLHTDLGRYIYRKYEIKTKQETGVIDKVANVYFKYLEWYLSPENKEKLNHLNNRTIWQYFEREEEKQGTSLNTLCITWPADVFTNVGKFLYDIIVNDIILQPEVTQGLGLKCSIPAFYTLFRNNGSYLVEQIKPHPFVSKLYKELELGTITINSLLVPSYCPPRPWTSIYTGGYIMTKTDFIRAPYFSCNSWNKLQTTPSQQLFPLFDSLNQLSSIPWIINCPILDIIIEIFQNGGSEKLNVPHSISALGPPPTRKKNVAFQEKETITMAQYNQKKCETYSLWCDALYRLSLANHFRNRIFWLPHNLDFRGRVYPVPPHLNHLSSDLSRSLLLFAKGKPLGPNGLDWLKLHVINLTNLKKGNSIKERLEFANDNIENILDSANKPLTGKMWWAESEEPWQTLAGCMEIANALKAPRVEQYESKFPIHQDGSCNGLQHYAALGRDQIGAESVNLYPFDTPKDVYTTVAAKVEKEREVDAKNNVKVAQLLDGYVKRKIIKQTVMTTVYGVTKFGAKLQIMKQLKDIEGFPAEHISNASLYLTEKTFSALKSMFRSAREIQDWFTTCARIISSICHENVEWRTPLGLPIVQPYTKQQKSLQRFNKNHERPDTLKQKNAFAPNFIHSLDSTHMMLTSLHCRQAGITFVSVHDCFWTHACTVDIMNRICREQFVALHSEPILEDLSKFFIQHYAPIYTSVWAKNKSTDVIYKSLVSVPEKGTFDINNVLSSVYFFS